MFDFFAQVLGFFESLLTFVSQLALNLWVAAETIGNLITFPLQLSGLLPSFIGSAMIIILALAILKFVINR